MRIDHIALWTTDLERCKRFYVDYFGAAAGEGYVNPAKGFASCFLSLGDGGASTVAYNDTYERYALAQSGFGEN